MKKLLCSLCISCLAGGVIAQNTTSDSVVLGSGYASQVWYQLETGQKTTVPATDWDIAFKTGVSATILINDGADVQLWAYPNGDTSAWASLDTAGITSWPPLYNAPENWETGAFNAAADGSQFDYGWGTYDMSTHAVNGSRLFVIQLSNGNYKKIIIRELATDGTYQFKYANLDGSNEVQATLNKNDFDGKNFAYYSLVSEQSLNPEPIRDDWDLLFTQYTDWLPMGPDTIPYKVTGVLSNFNVQAAMATPVVADQYDAYENHDFDSSRNAIGHNWKTYDMTQHAYIIADSTVYFVSSQQGDIWKIVFTSFEGSSTGLTTFNKTKLHTTAITGPDGKIASFALYPNPATRGRVTVSCNLKDATAATTHLVVTDISGRIQYEAEHPARQGMNLFTLSTGSWSQGIYLFTIEVAGRIATQKLVIR